jgi:hypothetical protein
LAWILITELNHDSSGNSNTATGYKATLEQLQGMITNIALITFAVGLLAVQVTRTIMMIYIVWQQIRRR